MANPLREPRRHEASDPPMSGIASYTTAGTIEINVAKRPYILVGPRSSNYIKFDKYKSADLKLILPNCIE